MSVMFIDDVAAGVTTLTFVTSGKTGATGPSNNTITVPALAAEGDLAVLFDACSHTSSGLVDDITPSGWTRIARQNVLNGWEVESVVSYKVLEAADLGATIIGMGYTNQSKVMLIFRPDVPITAITPSTWLTEGQITAQPAQQTAAASGQTAPLLVLGHAAGEAGPTFSTATPAFDAEVTETSVNYDLRVGYKVYNSSPADHDIRSSDAGAANVLMTGYLMVT